MGPNGDLSRGIIDLQSTTSIFRMESGCPDVSTLPRRAKLQLSFQSFSDQVCQLAKEIKSDKLARIVTEERKAALVLFYGDWCIDCRESKPTWNSWKDGRTGPIYMVHVMRGDPEWKDWSLDEIPTVAAFVEGTEVGRVHGTISTEGLDRLWKLISQGRA